jgi:uncharacterized membrane protein YgcG
MPPRARRGGRGFQLTVHATPNTHLLLFEHPEFHELRARGAQVVLRVGGNAFEGLVNIDLDDEEGGDEPEFPFRERAAPAAGSAAVIGARITGKIDEITARKSSWRLVVTGWLTLRLFVAAGEPDLVARYRLFQQFVRIVIPKSDPADRTLEEDEKPYSSNESASCNWKFVPGSEPDVDFRRLFYYACRTHRGGVVGRKRPRSFTGGVLYFLHGGAGAGAGAGGLTKTVFLVFKPRDDRAAVLAVGRGAMQKFIAFTTALVRDTLLPFDAAAPWTANTTMRATYFHLKKPVNAGAVLEASAAARAGYNQDVFPAIRVTQGGVTFIYYANSRHVIATSGDISDDALNAAVRAFIDDIVEQGGQGAVARDTRAPAPPPVLVPVPVPVPVSATSTGRGGGTGGAGGGGGGGRSGGGGTVMRRSRFVGASSHRAAPVALGRSSSSSRDRGRGRKKRRKKRRLR